MIKYKTHLLADRRTRSITTSNITTSCYTAGREQSPSSPCSLALPGSESAWRCCASSPSICTCSAICLAHADLRPPICGQSVTVNRCFDTRSGFGKANGGWTAGRIRPCAWRSSRYRFGWRPNAVILSWNSSITDWTGFLWRFCRNGATVSAGADRKMSEPVDFGAC